LITLGGPVDVATVEGPPLDCVCVLSVHPVVPAEPKQVIALGPEVSQYHREGMWFYVRLPQDYSKSRSLGPANVKLVFLVPSLGLHLGRILLTLPQLLVFHQKSFYFCV
jgi:hypothetical protein